MAIVRPTLQEIYNRIVADMEVRLLAANPSLTQLKVKPVSLLGILAAVFAGVIHGVYGLLSYIARQLFPDTADEEFLKRDGELHNLSWNPATYASGSVIFTGTADTVLPEGTEVQLITGVKYETTESAILTGGTATVPVIATNSGIDGNSSLVALTLSSPVLGVDPDATFTEGPSGGADIESVEEYRTRLIAYYQQTPSGGRAYDYERWAKEIAGIGQAWAYDLYNGPGTVGVIVANEGLPVATALVTECYDYIMTVRPLGSLVYVVNVVPSIVDITVLIPVTEYSKQSLITDQLDTLFDDKAVPGGKILLSNMNASILASTVSDYSIYSIMVDGVAQPIADIVPTGAMLLSLRSVNFGPLA